MLLKITRSASFPVYLLNIIDTVLNMLYNYNTSKRYRIFHKITVQECVYA